MTVYRFDPHVHTAETSACAWMPAKHVADLYHALGFSGIAITDHLYERYIASLPCRNDWDACMERYLAGYRLAKARGDATGLRVVLGAEITFPENGSDYLIYGFDEAFLFENPYLHRLGHEAFFQRFCDRLLILQAHPYRGGNRTVFTDSIHGVEVLNGNTRHKNDNARALALCQAHPDLLRTAGSDTHHPGDEGRAWMAFDAPVADSCAFAERVRQGKYRLGSDCEKALIDASNAFLEKGSCR